MLLLFLAAASTTLHPRFFADAVATSPNPSSYHHFKANNHLLDYIGNKFESTAIATHNTIIQKAKEEHDHDFPSPAESSSPTSVPATSWNTSNPTLSVDGGASFSTEDPTNDPTVVQGNVKEIEEIQSPTLLPSSFPTLQVKMPTSSTPTLMRINHKDTASPTNQLVTASSTPSAEKEDSTSTSPSITSFVPSPSQVPSQITQSPVYDVVVVTATPSSFATNDQDTTTLPSPTSSDNNDQNTAHDVMSSVSVETPQIICDISLSSSAAESFEQTHVLLVVLTKSIYDILESHLSKELYDLNGISLNVSTQKIIQADSDASSTTLRLHASLTGKISFSHLAPSQSEVIDLLLRHFDVLEFTDQLKFPFRLRTLEEEPLDEDPVVLNVNSVFFTLQDGNLVNVGYKNAAPIASSPTDNAKEASLTEHQIQMITVSLVIAALPFVIVASVLLVLRYVDDEGEVAYLEADDEDSTDSSINPEVAQQEVFSPSATAEMGDPIVSSAANAIEPSLQVQIDNVPSTPASARVPLGDISESQSEWSSISGSFYDADSSREIESPANSKIKTGMGLGIAVAGREYCQNKSTPYTYGSQAADANVDNSGIMSSLWDHDDDLEVYEDYILDV